MKNVVYADFNNIDSKGRVRLNCNGTNEDLAKLSLQLIEGMRLAISDGEIQATGIVEFSSQEKIWVAKIDKRTTQDC